MSAEGNIFKNCLLLLLFGLLFTPMLQQVFEFKALEPLKGTVNNPEDATFSKKDWIDGTYQEKKEVYINSMFGFRSFCIRLNNQIDYTLFNKANAKDVIVGADNYLFELNYIKSYTGEDFLGNDSISHTLNRMKFLSDTLKKLNKNLIIGFAPGKAFFYPEYIDGKYLKNKKGITNYSVFTNGVEKLGIDFIDFNKWFSEKKKTAEYPLYPQHGIHWSVYGAALASDSLIKKIESLRGIDMPNLQFKSVRLLQAQDGDYDCADAMNLLFRLKSVDLAYPNLLPTDSIGKIKPRVLVISDSFYWVMYSLGISNSFDSNHKIWYYNKQVYPESFKQELLVSSLNFSEAINNYDVIVVMATDNNLRNISWGFLENAVKNFINESESNVIKQSPEYIKKVQDFVKYITTQPTWIKDAEIRAKEKNITLDSMLILEAIWQIEHPN